MNQIPFMDDPLGKYWEQPKDIRNVEMDNQHVILTLRHLQQLHEYNSSIPSGVYPGKCWKRVETPYRHKVKKETVYLAWFGPETEDNKCSINFREVLMI